MSWVFQKIISDIIVSFNIVFGKKLLKVSPDYRLQLFCMVLISLPFGMTKMTMIRHIPQFHQFLFFCGGIMLMTAAICHYKAIQIGHVAIFSLVGRTGPVFTLLLSYLILRERFSGFQYLGFGLIIIGSMCLVKRDKKGWSFRDPGIIYGVTCTLLISIYATINTWLMQFYSIIDIFLLTRLGIIAGIICLFPSKGIWASIQHLKKHSFGKLLCLFCEQCIRTISTLLNMASMHQIGSASLVSILGAFGPIYTCCFAVVMSQECFRTIGLRHIIAFFAFGSGAVFVCFTFT